MTSHVRIGLRGRVAGLLLLALPLPILLKSVFSLWSGNVAMLGASALAYALFALGAVLTRRGVQREIAEAARPTTAAHGPPLKTLAALVVGFAAGFTAFSVVGHDLLASIAYAIGATVGHLLLYTPDMKEGRVLPAWTRRAAGEADARAILELAYERLESLNTAAGQIADREFRQRLGNISLAVGQILHLIETNPADLRRSRKFLNVYLDGAQQVATQYARAQAHEPSAEREHNFRTLLVDVENTCQQQYEKLLQHDALDLDVQIEVLSTRLRREGLA
ncbi:MAG: 5-bromo-4-chloroindolyl phosphate hydrolysis family protein [Rhodospirillales bacterium]